MLDKKHTQYDQGFDNENDSFLNTFLSYLFYALIAIFVLPALAILSIKVMQLLKKINDTLDPPPKKPRSQVNRKKMRLALAKSITTTSVNNTSANNGINQEVNQSSVTKKKQTTHSKSSNDSSWTYFGSVVNQDKKRKPINKCKKDKIKKIKVEVSVKLAKKKNEIKCAEMVSKVQISEKHRAHAVARSEFKKKNKSKNNKPKLVTLGRYEASHTLDYRYHKMTASEIMILENMKKHAIFLSEFSYHTHDGIVLNQAQIYIKTLAFVYHLHRFNLLQHCISHSHSDIHHVSSNLRTLIVHTISDMSLDVELILQTQKQLAEALQMGVSSSSKNGFIKISIQETPLLSAMSMLSKSVDQRLRMRGAISNFALRNWIHSDVVPLISMLDSHIHSDSVLPEEKEVYLSALKMLIIVVGEYCSHQRQRRMRREYENDNDTLAFLVNCKNLRDHYAHSSNESDSDYLPGFLSVARLLNEAQPLNLDHSLIFMALPEYQQDEVVTIQEGNVNDNPHQFFSTKPTAWVTDGDPFIPKHKI